MNTKSKKEKIIIFHHNDHDGFAGAAVIHHYLRINEYGEITFVKCDYGDKSIDKVYREYIEDNYIYKFFIVDLSFTKDTVHALEELNEIGHVVWIDHHTSSINLLNEYKIPYSIEHVISSAHCGAYLAYEYLFGNTNMRSKNTEIVLDYIDQYDTWRFKNYKTVISFHYRLDDKLENYNSDEDKIFKMEDILFNFTINDIDCITSNGFIIYRHLMNSYRAYRDKFGYESEIEGIKCYVINQKSNSLIFGEDIYNTYPICAVFAYDGEYYEYTLYSSDKDVDCSKIAEKFGGGGHKGAAGFRSKELVLKKIEE